MSMHRQLLILAAVSLILAVCLFILFCLNLGGKLDPTILYLIFSVACAGCACFFAGLAFLRKAFLSSSPTARVLWGIAGCASLIPTIYILRIFLKFA